MVNKQDIIKKFKLSYYIFKNKILRKGVPQADAPIVELPCPRCEKQIKIPFKNGLEFHCPKCGKKGTLCGGI